MEYIVTDHGSLKLVNPPKIDYVNYWGGSKSTMVEQIYNVNRITFRGRTKVDSIMEHLIGDSILEIGAAPGELLRHASNMGYYCEGIAPEAGQFVSLHSGCIIHNCFFEEYVGNKLFDNVVAMDVFEHIEDGQAFLEKCKSQLNTNGQIIFMLPVLEEMKNPEEFKCAEHIWLYSMNHLKAMGFSEFDKWTDGHTIAIYHGSDKEGT